MEWFHLTREQIATVLYFAAREIYAAPGDREHGDHAGAHDAGLGGGEPGRADAGWAAHIGRAAATDSLSEQHRATDYIKPELMAQEAAARSP